MHERLDFHRTIFQRPVWLGKKQHCRFRYFIHKQGLTLLYPRLPPGRNEVTNNERGLGKHNAISISNTWAHPRLEPRQQVSPSIHGRAGLIPL